MPVKELALAFAIPKFHVAKRQGKNHYQQFVSLFSIATRKITYRKFGSLRSYKKTTLPAGGVGRAVIYKKKKGNIMEAKKKKAHAVKSEFKENENGDICCPRCGCTDLDQFGIDGFECNNCNLRIS
jgi:hypothetical protein